MADQLLNKTGLTYFYNRLKTVFALKSEAGETNVIETVKRNGTALTPDANKAVDVEVPVLSVKRNGTALTPDANKAVDVEVPTKVSDLTNDSGFQTASQVSSAISSAVASAYKYKGSVADYAHLPANPETGDVYNTEDTGTNYAWNGSAWDSLGQIIDTSTLWTTTNLTAITTEEIDAIVV